MILNGKITKFLEYYNMSNKVDEFILEKEYLGEVSRWVSSIAKDSGKPNDHVQQVWDDTEKELITTNNHHGARDKLSQISKLVKQKMGVKDDKE